MTIYYNKPEAQVLNKTEPAKEPFWKRVKNFFKRVIGRPAKKVINKTATGLKKTGKFFELILRVSLLNPLGQFLLGFIAVYFIIWMLNVLYMYIGGLAFIAILPVVVVMVGLQVLVMALNEDTIRKMMKQRQQRGYT